MIVDLEAALLPFYNVSLLNNDIGESLICYFWAQIIGDS
jgi:hypothetical protein